MSVLCNLLNLLCSGRKDSDFPQVPKKICADRNYTSSERLPVERLDVFEINGSQHRLSILTKNTNSRSINSKKN